MTECIQVVDYYISGRSIVVGTKTSIVVVLFFSYLAYIITLAVKHLAPARVVKNDENDPNIEAENAKNIGMAEKFSDFHKDMWARNAH